ncbi:putative ribonuclease H-like domain-containing protein [Tanacetum coccineum]
MKNVHIRFLVDKPIIAGDGPKWLFDIDSLTKSMNYVPVVAGTNSNDFVCTEESVGTGHSTKETRSSQDYILMPLWKDGSLFDSSSKNASNDEPQPSSDPGKKDDESVSKESRIDDQEKPEKCTQDVNTDGPSINTASTNFNTSSLNINTVSPTVTTTPLEATHADFFSDETKLDMSNITTTYPVPSTPNIRIHKDHSLDHVIGDVQSGVQTRRMTKTTNEQGFISAVYEGKTHEDLYTCLFPCFLSQEEPKKVIQALKDPSWIEAMQEGLLQFKLQQVWTLVDLPYGKRAIGTKWVYRIKKDERFARIEAIRLFLAYVSFKDFIVYQMDMKSVFLYGKIKEEVYVCQPPGFEDPEFPDKVFKIEEEVFVCQPPGFEDPEFPDRVYKVEKALYVYIKHLELEDGIFICQDKYVDEILKKICFSTMRIASTPMETSKPLLKDAEAEDVDVHLYRSMIGSLMYLTASRPDIMFVVCACARFQVTPKVSHLHAVKRIFRYLKGQPKLGLWYPKDSPFDLEAYTDSDYAGASLDRKSTTGGCQFLGSRLISWQCKKQTIVANSTTEVEYVAAANCCGQTKHIKIRHHFIRDSNEKKLIQMIKIHTDQNVTDLLTKAFDVGRFQYLIATKYAQMMLETAADDAIQVSTVGLTYYSYALTENPTIYVLLIQQFWNTAIARTLDNREMEITTTIDGKGKIVYKASIKRHLKLEDFDGVSTVEPVSTTGALVSIAGASSAKDKGKAIMEELHAKIDEEERQRIARVQEEASSFNIEEWDDIQARVEADEEFAQ